MRTQEQIQISIEETEHELKKLNEVLVFVMDSKLEGDVKKDITKRIESEIVWLEQIKGDEQEALRMSDIAFEMAFEDYRERKQEQKNGMV